VQAVQGAQRLTGIIGNSRAAVEPRCGLVSKTDGSFLIGQGRARFTRQAGGGAIVTSAPEEVVLSERAAHGADEDVLRARTELERRVGSGTGSVRERQENKVASVVNFVAGSSQILVTSASRREMKGCRQRLPLEA
jgi:hypothetical protein